MVISEVQRMRYLTFEKTSKRQMFVCVGKFSFQIVKLNVRENRWGNQECTIQRKPMGQSVMDNPERHWQNWPHKTKKKKTQKHNITQKTKKMSNTDPTKN